MADGRMIAALLTSTLRGPSSAATAITFAQSSSWLTSWCA